MTVESQYMLQSIKQLYGKPLWASDGEIGSVQDFYFDDRNWVVRYVIANTGPWLTGRQVLLSPHAFGSIYRAEKGLIVNLTLKQIENSPSIDSHKPVSRRFEEAYFQYYGWPNYWDGDGLWGMNGLGTFGIPEELLQNKPMVAHGQKSARPDSHLRRARSMSRYHIDASDAIIGHVCDFMMNPQNWEIRQLVIKTGHAPSAEEVRIPTSKVQRISYEDSTVFVKLSQGTAVQNPVRHLILGGAVD